MSPAEVFFGRTAKVVLPDKDLNNNKNFITYKVGDRVLRRIEGATKMGKKYEPGYIISRVSSSNKTYGVRREGDSRVREFKCHHNQLRLVGDEIEATICDTDEEVQNLKYLANLTVKPNWVIGGLGSKQNPETSVTNFSSSQSSSNTQPILSPVGSQFSGFTSAFETNDPEIQRRKSCRPKNPINRYIPS